MHTYATNSEGTSYSNQVEFTTDTEFAGGSGSINDPYLIETAEQLNNLRNSPDKNFKQIADIDLSDFNQGQGWNPIGNEENKFTGSYDGNDHSITNLTINRPEEDYVGLFGFTEDSEIERLTLEIADGVTGNNYVGGLIGWNEGNIRTSKALGGAIGYSYIGGFAGKNIVDITASYAKTPYGANIQGNDTLGGFEGLNEGNISESYAKISIQVENGYAGGLVGINKGSIWESYASGDVTASDYTGGLAGINEGEITNTYAATDVTAQAYLGGLLEKIQIL